MAEENHGLVVCSQLHRRSEFRTLKKHFLQSIFPSGLPVLNTAFTAAVSEKFTCQPLQCSKPGTDGIAFDGEADIDILL